MNNLNSYLIRGSNGAVDLDATLEKFRGDLTDHITALEVAEARMASAVSSVFDANKGKRIQLPVLKNLALSQLGFEHSEYAAMFELCDTYIHANAGERGKSIFGISKGKGGGCVRWSDQPEATPAK